MTKTAKELKESFGRRKPNEEETRELYRLRELEVEALARKSVITVADIQTLEWGGRFAIANEHLDKCDDQARHALLHDQHHGVRAAASLFKPTEKPAPQPAPAPAVPAEQASVADVALALMNDKQRIATRYGLKTQAGVEEMILSTHPTALLERAEAFIAGFEDDDMQEGVNELLADLRAVRKPIR